MCCHVGVENEGKQKEPKGRLTHSMPFSFRAHAVPLPRRAAKGLECVFPI